MIIGCYTMDLYCSRAKWSTKASMGVETMVLVHDGGSFPHKFDGPTEADCKKQARQRGWRFFRAESGMMDAICPRCVKASKGTKA